MAAGNNKKIDDIDFPHEHYVLALPGWYPTALDALPGDFNQRHVKAASLYKPQIVLYIGKDNTGTLTKTDISVTKLSDEVIEYKVVYPKNYKGIFDAIQSNLIFVYLLFKHSDIIRKKWGTPQLLHAYIVMRGGLAAWLLGIRWKLPYILTENWTIYYPADPGYLENRNFIFRWLVKKVHSKSKKFLPVSHNLKRQVATLIGERPASVIPNVVETDMFNIQEQKAATPFKFIHISTMIYQKNPDGILRAFKQYLAINPNLILQMVGPYPEEVYAEAKRLELLSRIHFTGAVSYKEVANYLSNANALVLFSRYENLPCVILEAFCCGLPVICTNVGGVAELISNENGFLITSENEEELFLAMRDIVEHYDKFDKESISKKAKEQFSYQSVGKKVNEVYDEILKVRS